MTKQEIINIAIQELKDKTFGVTEQFLEVHEVDHFDGQPTVEHVSIGGANQRHVVHFTVKGEKFYFSVYVQAAPPYGICGVDTTPYCSISFEARSETHSSEYLEKLTKLLPTGKHNKGDSKLRGRSFWRYSSLLFEPNPEPDNFESKLSNTLAFLEQDREGIKQLIKHHECILAVAMYSHNGNGSIDGIRMSNDLLKRLANLDIEIDFDLYASGNFFIS